MRAGGTGQPGAADWSSLPGAHMFSFFYSFLCGSPFFDFLSCVTALYLSLLHVHTRAQVLFIISLWKRLGGPLLQVYIFLVRKFDVF